MKERKNQDVNYYYDLLMKYRSTVNPALSLIPDNGSEVTQWAFELINGMKYDGLMDTIYEWDEEFNLFLKITAIMKEYKHHSIYSMFDLYRFALAADCWKTNINKYVDWLHNIASMAQRISDMSTRDVISVERRVKAIVRQLDTIDAGFKYFVKSMPDYKLSLIN